MIAVSAHAIWRQESAEIRELSPVIAADAACGGTDDSTGLGAVPLAAMRARLGIDESDVVSSVPAAPLVNVTWLASELFGIVIP